jgi:hypothetical protein
MCYSIDEQIQGLTSRSLNEKDAATNNAMNAALGAELEAIARSFVFTN